MFNLIKTENNELEIWGEREKPWGNMLLAFKIGFSWNWTSHIFIVGRSIYEKIHRPLDSSPIFFSEIMTLKVWLVTFGVNEKNKKKWK